MNKARIIVDAAFNLTYSKGEAMSYRDEAHAMMTLQQFVAQRLQELFPLVSEENRKIDQLAAKLIDTVETDRKTLTAEPTKPYSFLTGTSKIAA